MQPDTRIPLVSSEIAGLWTAYMSNSLGTCTLKYFLNKAEDKEIQPILQRSLDLSVEYTKMIASIFTQENIPVPVGFTDEDVNVNAPRLFSDSFSLFYAYNLSKIGMTNYSLSLTHAARGDIRQFFSKTMLDSIDLFNRIADITLSKGLFIRAPQVEVNKEIDFIDREGFLAGLLSEPRRLLVTEILNIFSNTLTNIIGRALITGFGQAAKSQEVRDYMLRGRDTAAKHTKVFTDMLAKEDIPAPSTPHSFVTDSTTAPFSDKLIMFHVSLLNAAGIGNYGVASAASLRHDIQTTYIRLAAEIAQYAQDGINIMIKNKWMEQPPQAINHKKL
jgi:hypothetical protein